MATDASGKALLHAACSFQSADSSLPSILDFAVFDFRSRLLSCSSECLLSQSIRKKKTKNRGKKHIIITTIEPANYSDPIHREARLHPKSEEQVLYRLA